VKYAFMHTHEDEFALKRMCAVLGVSRSGYYEWLTRPRSARAARDEVLLGQIRRVHTSCHEAYGAKKTWIELKARGVLCGKHRVARLRKNEGIEARRKRRFRMKARYQQTAPAPNLLAQRFDAGRRDRVWVGDTTVIQTRAGLLYVAVLLDLYARRVVGWAGSNSHDLKLALGALGMALQQRRPGAGLIHHSDQGSIYTARLYREALQSHGLRASMSGKGAPHDNAVAESFFSTLKNELVHHCSFATRESACKALSDYIELFYNRRRRHQGLGYVSPVDFEAGSGVA
jgi:transposase InsO family protein